MDKKVVKRLMVVSSCGLILTGIPVAQAEEATGREKSTINAEKSTNEVLQAEIPPTKVQGNIQEEKPKAQIISDEGKIPSVPVLKGVKDQAIKKGDMFDPQEGVTAMDEKDGDLTKLIVTTGTVDTNEPGDYSLIYTVMNSQGQTASETMTVHVEKEEQTSLPEVRRETYTLEIDDFTTWRGSDLKAQITERLILKGNNGVNASLEDVTSFTIDQPNATDTLGEKKINLAVTASDGTVSEKTILVTVVNGLRIEARDFSISCGESFNLYEGIQAYETVTDGSEKTLGTYDPKTKVGIEVIKNSVDGNTPGEYDLIYRVHSSLGEVIDKKVTVFILEKPILDRKLAIFANNQVMTVGDILTDDMILDWVEEVTMDCRVSFEVLDQAIPVDNAQRLTTAGTYRIRYTAAIEGIPSLDSKAYKEITLTVRDRMTYSYNQNQTIRTTSTYGTPQYGSASTAKQLPKTGETNGNWLNPLLGFSLLGFAAFLKRERLLTKFTNKK